MKNKKVITEFTARVIHRLMTATTSAVLDSLVEVATEEGCSQEEIEQLVDNVTGRANELDEAYEKAILEHMEQHGGNEPYKEASEYKTAADSIDNAAIVNVKKNKTLN